MKICIVGAGATGLTAGYELAKKGNTVTIFESGENVGGLVNTIRIGNEDLEVFYHHIFTNDTAIINLIDELGLTSDLMWLEPKNAMYINRTLYPFTSPMDLLRFKELSLIERIRMGMLVFQAKFVKDWKDLEHMSAKDWIIKNAGKNVYEKVWGPLINSKFDIDKDNISATWIWNKFKLRGSTRGKNISKELLGYMKGSFGVIYKKLEEEITKNNGRVLYNSPVTRIVPKEDKTLDVYSNGEVVNFDKVIVTTAPAILEKMDIPFSSKYREKLGKIKYKSNICAILQLSESLSDYYWTTIAERDFPFVLLIEHTKLVSKEGYKSHIVYLSRYLDETHKMFSQSDQQILKEFIKYIKVMYPHFDEKTILNSHLSRTIYSQPVVVKEYSKIMPEIKTSVDNLYLSSMAQIYPEDRGQSYAIRSGKQIADIIVEES